MDRLKLGSLFDGSGGFPLGGLLAGVTPVWASEIEPFPIRVTTKRLPGMRHLGDVSSINGAEIEPVDIITFGSPCTDMSIAGKRAGLEGAQSSLFYQAIRIIKEMRCATNGRYPRWVCWENVVGAFSSNQGFDFKAVLDAVIGIAEPGASVPMPEKNRWPYADIYMGDRWSVAYRVFDAQFWGVPQRRHRLMCGDATSAEDVATLMGEKKANLILTDPPYGVSFKSSDGLTIQNDSIKGDDFYNFLLQSLTNMVAHLEPGGAAYVFHADTEGLNFRRAFIDAGLHLAGVCIWVKNSLVLGRSDYQWQHEPVLYGFLQNGKHRWYSDRKQTTIWNYDKPKRNENHPTSKPLDLLGYPICNSSQENAIVLDTFGGSGSTLMACEQLGRICYTMELDEKYASVILRRYAEGSGDTSGIHVLRDGECIPYADLVKEI